MLAWLAGFTLIDSSIVSLALPDMARQFDLSVRDLAWVSTGYLVALAASLLAAGRLSDRFGPRVVMAGGALGFLVTTLAAGLAPTYELLVAARIVQGIAGGVLFTVSLAIVAGFPVARRASAIGIYFTSGATGAVIGPVIGGWLTDLGGWRLVFLAQLPLPLLVLAMTLAALPTTAGRRQRFDVPGVLAASVFIVSATYALLELPVAGGLPSAAFCAGVAIVAITAFVFVERRAQQPAVRLSIFRSTRFVVSTLAGAGAWFAIMSSTVYSALYLQLGRGFEATESGFILLAGPAVALIFFPFGGRAVGWIGVQRAMLAGLVLLVLGGALMIGWDAATDPAWLVAVLLIGGAGIAITLVASATDALSEFGPDEIGTGSAVFNSLRQMGAGLGVAAPAVAYEFIAHGSRSIPAALGGSTAAFILRTVVLAVPLVLLAGSLALQVGRDSNQAERSE